MSTQSVITAVRGGVLPVMAICGMLAWEAAAGTVTYKGPGGDLFDGDNWSASSWTSADSLLVSTDDAAFPSGGFTFSGDLAANAQLKFGTFPNVDVYADFGGRSLNTAELRLGTMHDDNHRQYNFIASGGFKDVEKLMWQTRGNLCLTNGVFEVQYGFQMWNWWPVFKILKDAEFVISALPQEGKHGMNRPGIHGDASGATLTIDGGRIRISGRELQTDHAWQRLWLMGQSNVPATFKILNGGEYVDDTAMPQDMFYSNVRVLIDGGSYIATNSVKVRRNTEWCAYDTTFAVTNGTMRIAQFYTGLYNLQEGNGFAHESGYNARNTRITFHDSEETFTFAGDKYWNSLGGKVVNSPDGMIVAPGSLGNTIRLSGSRNAWRSGWFIMGGLTNALEVAGGTFAVTNQFLAISGEESSATFSGGVSEFAALRTLPEATNFAMRVKGSGRVRVNGRAYLEAMGGSLEVESGAFSTSPYILGLSGEGARMAVAGGGVVTGNVLFAANDVTVTVGAGSLVFGERGEDWQGPNSSLAFTPGKSNQVLVISNGTYMCEKPFYNQFATAESRKSTAQNSEAIPFTNCPNSRIEFRGETPAFITTSAKPHGASGNVWQTFALGQMINPETMDWTRDHFELDNPVRLRYVMPKNGYAQAPFRNTNAGEGGTVGGNAQFEFDMSGYEWPKATTAIPLIYDAGGYCGWGGTDYRNIDVDGLNVTNAERLPENPRGSKCRLALSDDCLTLQLVVPGTSGTAILIR